MPEMKHEFTRRDERIETLVKRVEGFADRSARAVTKELLEAVIELHGAALERILDAVDALPNGESALRRIAKDDLVSGVLSLHGIHPVPLQVRVAAAVKRARSYLNSHGGDVELTSVEEGVANLRVLGACGSCSASSQTMKNAVEAAIFSAAPEVTAMIPEAMPAPPNSNLVVLQAR